MLSHGGPFLTKAIECRVTLQTRLPAMQRMRIIPASFRSAARTLIAQNEQTNCSQQASMENTKSIKPIDTSHAIALFSK